MIKIKLLFLCSILLFLSCNLATDISTDTITIVAGTSKITGRIITPDGQNKDSIMVTISVLHPISGENIRHKVLADQSGKFSVDIDVETDISYIRFVYQCKSI